jgi:hypothetical protein
MADSLVPGGHARRGRREITANRNRKGAIDWLVLGCIALSLATAVATVALWRLFALLAAHG